MKEEPQEEPTRSIGIGRFARLQQIENESYQKDSEIERLKKRVFQLEAIIEFGSNRTIEHYQALLKRAADALEEWNSLHEGSGWNWGLIGELKQAAEGGALMTKEVERKNYLLLVAARYIREHCPFGLIDYDQAQCDGECLAGDCELAAGP